MSLHEKSVLIDLTLTSITTSRIDQSVTADVLHRNAAGKDAGRWVSKLWPKEAIDPIQKHDAKTGTLHREMTLPWLDNSKRILPTARFDEYMRIMRDRRPEREDLVKSHFIDRYAHWLHEAATMRQGLFRPSEYPSAAAAAQRFSFRVEAEPVPHGNDFRVKLSQSDIADMQATLESRLSEAARIARNELVYRLQEPLLRVVERLTDPDAKFQDSLIHNLRSIVDALPSMNITEDATIEDARLRILHGLAKLDPDSLRESRSDRSRAAAEANQILASLAPWMNPIADAA